MTLAKEIAGYCQDFFDHWDAAESTRANRYRIVRNFIQWLSVNEPEYDTEELPIFFEYAVQDWIQNYVKPGTQNYHNTLVGTFKTIMHWMEDQHITRYSPRMNIKWRATAQVIRHNTEKLRKKQEELPERKEIYDLLRTAKNERKWRVYYAIFFAYNFGFRGQDICDMKFRDFVTYRGRYYVRVFGKAEKRKRTEAEVEIGKRIYESITAYQEALGMGDDAHVCGNYFNKDRTGEAISTFKLREDVKKFSKRVIGRRVRLHRFKTCGITHRLVDGESEDAVARLYRTTKQVIRRHYDVEPGRHGMLHTVID